MSFVIYFPDGFLKRDGAHNRSLVSDINEATTWAKSNHAKNAARAAIEGGIKLNRGEKVQIIPVNIKISCAVTIPPDGPATYDCESYDPRSK